MSTGVVTNFIEDRGFGFIKPDDGGSDVFVHVRDVANADKLNPGQRVSFEIVTDEKRGKLRGDRVRVLDDDRCAAEARVWKITPED